MPMSSLNIKIDGLKGFLRSILGTPTRYEISQAVILGIDVLQEIRRELINLENRIQALEKEEVAK